MHSLQYAHGTSSRFRSIDEYFLRTSNIRKKINSILDTLYALEESCGVNLTSYRHSMHDMIAIRDAIGVYGIYASTHPKKRLDVSNVVLWYRYEPMKTEASLSQQEGKDWLDYFGKDDISGISDAGGWIVVSLSDKGIKYLNRIAESVSYLSSSNAATTVTTTL
jgi:hypothetical protein